MIVEEDIARIIKKIADDFTELISYMIMLSVERPEFKDDISAILKDELRLEEDLTILLEKMRREREEIRKTIKEIINKLKEKARKTLEERIEKLAEAKKPEAKVVEWESEPTLNRAKGGLIYTWIRIPEWHEHLFKDLVERRRLVWMNDKEPRQGVKYVDVEIEGLISGKRMLRKGVVRIKKVEKYTYHYITLRGVINEPVKVKAYIP